MGRSWDKKNLRVQGWDSPEELCRYLKSGFEEPTLVRKWVPLEAGYWELEIHDLKNGDFLGLWQGGDFDFSGAPDRVVEQLSRFFRALEP